MKKSFKNKKIIVTGGSGFLGTHLLNKLHAKGFRNISIVSHKKYDLVLPGEVKKMYKFFRPNIVFHLAGSVGGIGINSRNPGRFFYENAMINLNVIHQGYINKVEKIISTGTVSSYPSSAPIPLKEKYLWQGYPGEANSSYGIAKRIIHSHSLSYKRQYKFNSVLLLLSNLYGPMDNFNPNSSHVVPALIKKFVDAKRKGKKSVVVWGDGRATRDFCYVEDVAEGIIKAAQKYNKPDPINLGSGKEVSIKKISLIIKAKVKFKGSIKWDTSKPIGPKRRFSNINRAKKELGFKPDTSLDKGLEKTINWYIKNK